MTKDQINRLIHSYVEPERCWHKHDPKNVDECLLCKNAFQGTNGEPYDCEQDNPDYSSRAHFPDLTGKLFGDERMWLAFTDFLDDKWEMEVEISAFQFIPWLFSDFSRFYSLFAEFLCLDETREEFGIIKCEDNMVAYPHCVRPSCNCNGTGKVLTPWALYVKEIKEGKGDTTTTEIIDDEDE